MLSRLLSQLGGAVPAAADSAAAPAVDTSLLRRFVAADTYPAYTLPELCAHPWRRRAAEILAGGDAPAQAEAPLRSGLAQQGDSAVDRMLLAEVLHRQGGYAQAVDLLHGLLDDTGQMGARAAALLAEQAFLRGDYIAAQPLAKRAAAVAPRAASCQIILGNLCDAAGVRDPRSYAQALEHFRRACAARPELPLARVYLATALLRENAFREGLGEWTAAECLGGTYANRHLCPVWDGRPLRNERLLILTHSGYGDIIQFLRFARHLRAREPQARLSLATRAGLGALARSTGLFEAVFEEGIAGEFDWQVSQTHLPLLLDLDAADLCAHEPYLEPSPARVTQAAEWLAPRRPGRLRAGLRWTGFAGYTDATRSLRLADLRELLAVEGIDWVSLAESAVERGEAVREFGLQDVSSHLDDFEATGALMRHLDLVIAVDTSVAHLAGALKLPTWLLARPNPDWRWGREGESTPWYSAVRVFRHPGPGLDWAAVARQMAAALRERVRTALP